MAFDTWKREATLPDPATTPKSVAKSGLTFSIEQRALISALENHSASLSAMYRGGLSVLGNASNPDRFAQSAHSIRELMEKLPQILNVPTKAHNENLKGKVIELRDAYSVLQKTSRCFSVPDAWDAEIDRPLRTFLSRVHTFFDWFRTHRPRRRDEVHRVLVRLEASGRALPDPLASLNVDAWEDRRGYFVSVSHHGHPVEEEEFRQRLDDLARFLLDMFEPKTFDDFAAIDALLAEDENA
jgi:hypothetical protein